MAKYNLTRGVHLLVKITGIEYHILLVLDYDTEASSIEFLPAALSESPLRRELVADELQMHHGIIPFPQKPAHRNRVEQERTPEIRSCLSARIG